MLPRIDSKKAVDVAYRFFGQCYSEIESKTVMWNDGSWLITLSVGLMYPQIKTIRIDSFGRILEIT